MKATTNGQTTIPDECGHLVLTRKVTQTIEIGGITICVEQIKGNRVRIGIVAPRSVHIRRGELEPRAAA